MLTWRDRGACTLQLGLLGLEVHCLKVANELFKALAYRTILTMVLLDPFRAVECRQRSLVLGNKILKLNLRPWDLGTLLVNTLLFLELGKMFFYL